MKNLNLSVYEVWNIRCYVFAIVRITVQYSGHGDKSYDKKLSPGVVPNSDPRQIITPLVLVGLGLGVGEGLGLGNQIAISTRGGNNLAGVENGHNTCLKLVNVLICNDPLLNIGYICSLNKCMTLHS